MFPWRNIVKTEGFENQIKLTCMLIFPWKSNLLNFKPGTMPVWYLKVPHLNTTLSTFKLGGHEKLIEKTMQPLWRKNPLGTCTLLRMTWQLPHRNLTIAQCGSLRIFRLDKFYVKSKIANIHRNKIRSGFNTLSSKKNLESEKLSKFHTVEDSTANNRFWSNNIGFAHLVNCIIFWQEGSFFFTFWFLTTRSGWCCCFKVITCLNCFMGFRWFLSKILIVLWFRSCVVEPLQFSLLVGFEVHRISSYS